MRKRAAKVRGALINVWRVFSFFRYVCFAHEIASFLACPASSVYLFLPGIVPITLASSAMHTYVLACMHHGRSLHLERKWPARPTLQGWPLDKKIRAWGVCWLALKTPIVTRQVCSSFYITADPLSIALFSPYSWAGVFFFFFFLALRSSFIHFFGICLCVLFLFAATGFPVLPRARWCQSFPSPQVLFRILMNCIYVHIHSIYFKFPVKRRCVCRKRRTTAEAACWFSFSCLVVVFYRVAFFSLPALLFPCVQRLIAMRS